MRKNRKRYADYLDERDDDLLRAYKEVVSAGVATKREAIRQAVSMPSRRFWVDERRAYEMVLRMRRGEGLGNMHSPRREMYAELYRRYLDLRDCMPGSSVEKVVWRAVHSTAPCFYLTSGSARVILWRAMRKRRQNILRRARPTR